MKKRQLDELRQKKPSALVKELEKLRAKKIAASVDVSIGKEKNIRVVKNIRRDIAQILTIIQEQKKKP